MLFSSFAFLFQFLPATALAFAAARRHSPRAGVLVLACASLVFYGAWRPVYLLLLLASITANFSLGLIMDNPRWRRPVGLAGVALNLALLCYFKYANFLVGNVDVLTGSSIPLPNIILPLGISFFTFQQIAYLVDVMRDAPVERDPLSYTLFVSFFPHLIAGPLVHHKEMIPQFKRERSGRSAVLAARGIAIFIAGLFKKVVIADSLAQFVTPVFQQADSGGLVPAQWAWLATLSYTLQIYFDFSGYSDMAIGLALMFGIRLPVNFRSPYRALSIIDFWRRWHITLSRFLRDYLYIPLGGNRRGSVRRYLNLLITMLLGGLWHGAGWNFPLWGGLHGFYLAINHVWRERRNVGNKAPRTPAAHAMAWLLTFAAVTLAWIFFRATTLDGAFRMLGGLFGSQGDGKAFEPDGIVRVLGLQIFLGPQGALSAGAVFAALALVIALAMPNVPQIFGYREYRRAPEPRTALRWLPNGWWALIIALAFALAMFGMWQRLEFLYFQF
jgi:D-alanyl-lipoteichoic acid acyltransferase DltB (MBOAT superfamily)